MHLIQDRLIDVITAGIDNLDEKPEIKKVWAKILEFCCSMDLPQLMDVVHS